MIDKEATIVDVGDELSRLEAEISRQRALREPPTAWSRPYGSATGSPGPLRSSSTRPA
jgi:hypothetical protein